MSRKPVPARATIGRSKCERGKPALDRVPAGHFLYPPLYDQYSLGTGCTRRLGVSLLLPESHRDMFHMSRSALICIQDRAGRDLAAPRMA